MVLSICWKQERKQVRKKGEMEGRRYRRKKEEKKEERKEGEGEWEVGYKGFHWFGGISFGKHGLYFLRSFPL